MLTLWHKTAYHDCQAILGSLDMLLKRACGAATNQFLLDVGQGRQIM